MATIVYLDADDEITSAAARIRASTDDRVGLVLPFGSRVATSRINFRLLAREAAANARRLDIVAPDASARALAASAGLAVFTSVGEYEAALDAEEAGAPAPVVGTGSTEPGVGSTAGAAGTALGTGQGATAIDPSRDVVPTQRIRQPLTEPASGDLGAPGIGELPGDPGPRVDDRAVRGRDAGGRRWRRGFILALALLVVGGGAAYAAVNVLPTAQVTLTPRIETIGPVRFEVTADPAATVVDADRGVIPATTVEIPVTASGEFAATGKKVVREKARGGVRFTNCDPSASYSIPRGTPVRTRDGTAFEVDEAVFLPVAIISGAPPDVSVKCTTSEVSVTAAEAGEGGNVGAGAIRVVPARYNRNLVRVTNPSPTSGGSREEFPKVTKEDVDAAIEQLKGELATRLDEALAEGTSIPDGVSAFPETATLAGLATDVDPATLPDQEVPSFALTLTGTGTVQAVDATPIERIAAQRLDARVGEGYELVNDSTTVEVGEGSVKGGVITFDVSATAKQLRTLDPAALVTSVLGRPEADARAALAPYGDVVIDLWPDFVATVPSDASRVSLVLADPVDDGAQAATPSPGPTEPPTPEPTASDGVPGGSGPPSAPASLFPLESPGDGEPSEPVPSG